MSKRIVAAMITLLLWSNTGHVVDRAKERKRCDSLQREIGRIHARMRQPYKASQGERYRERLRKLRLEWAKTCR